MSEQKEVKRITTNTIQEMKQKGEKIAMLTSYDYSMASIVDEGGVDVILVGDSASNVMAGHETTLPITLDQMIYHAQSVVRAVKRALVVVDLPFPPRRTRAPSPRWFRPDISRPPFPRKSSPHRCRPAPHWRRQKPRRAWESGC